MRAVCTCSRSSLECETLWRFAHPLPLGGNTAARLPSLLIGVGVNFNPTSSTFGKMTTKGGGTGQGERNLQLSLRLYF